MKIDRRIVIFIIYMVLGVSLKVLGILGVLDSFWSGMGSAFIVIGAIRVIQTLRYSNDESYREKRDIEEKDERNHFIRNKAWAWTGNLFVLIAATASIALKLLEQELLSMAAGSAIIILSLLFWICYLVLKKKY